MKNYRCFILGLIGILTSTTFSCSETEVEPEDYTHTLYQLNCTYPWENDPDIEQELVNLESYLNEQGIMVLEVGYKHSLIEMDCRGTSACSCPSGAEYLLKLNNRNGRELLDLNEGWIEL